MSSSTQAERPVSVPHRDDAEAAGWLLEQWSLRTGELLDRLHEQRMLQEAARACVEEGAADEWWSWLCEALRSMGHGCRPIDVKPEALHALAEDGAFIVVRRDQEWLAAHAGRGGGVEVLRYRGRNERCRDGDDLARRIGVPADEALRCVVIEPRDARSVAGEGAAATPVERLWSLFRPESSDLWIIVIFALANGILALATPIAVESLVNTVTFGQLLQPIVILAVMLLAFLVFSAAVRALQTYVVELIQRRLFARIAVDLAYRLPRTEAASLDGMATRELVNRFFDVMTVQKSTAQLLLDGVSLVLGTLVGMAVLAFYHPWLLGFDIVLLALIAFAIFVLGRGAVKTSIKESKAKYEVAAWLEELAGCPTVFRNGVAAEFALGRAGYKTHKYLTARQEHFRVLMRQILFALGLQALASTVLLGLGGWLVISKQLTLGQLVAAELIVTIIVGSFAKLGKHMESWYDMVAAIDKLGALFDLPVEPQQGLFQLPGEYPIEVHAHDVSYSTPTLGTVLDGLNLQIDGGSRVLIPAASGRGSVLLELLFGLRKASSGHLTLNDVDPGDLRPDVLRSKVALVRDIEIFTGSVAENVHLERPDVSVQDVRDALKAVGLEDTVEHLPDGLETRLMEGGYPLTPPEARRLMLARAIAGRPRLLLVDGTLDSFSDAEAAQLVEVLASPTRDWTLFLVTARDIPAGIDTRIELTGHSLSSLRRDKSHG